MALLSYERAGSTALSYERAGSAALFIREGR